MNGMFKKHIKNQVCEGKHKGYRDVHGSENGEKLYYLMVVVLKQHSSNFGYNNVLENIEVIMVCIPK